MLSYEKDILHIEAKYNKKSKTKQLKNYEHLDKLQQLSKHYNFKNFNKFEKLNFDSIRPKVSSTINAPSSKRILSSKHSVSPIKSKPIYRS